MLTILKSFIKNQLRSRDYFLTWVNPTHLTGFDLEDDLRRVITCSNPLIFDVGANEGQTIDMMQRVFGAPRVFSFEPSPRLYEGLRQRGFAEGVKIFNVGMGSSAGTLAFHEYERSVLNSFHEIDPCSDNPFSEVTKVATLEVAVETVDGVLAREGLDGLDLLKIDTQGHDLEVLRGAEASLASGCVQHVLIELNYASLYKGQAAAGEIQSLLLSHGYRLVDLYEKHRHKNTIAWCTALYRHCG